MPDLLLELRSEEIPARMQRKAAGDLKKMVTDGLVEAGLTYEAAREYWTPRRLALDIRGLTARSKDVREDRKGPSTKAPEQAVQGFLRAAGLASIDEADVHTDPKKGDFYVAHIVRPGRDAEAIIAEVVPAVVRAFPWPRSMRWGAASGPKGRRYGGVEGRGGEALRWVRPLQSIVCTFGPETAEPVVVDFDVDGIRSGNVTYGHRFHSPGAISVRRFEDYAAKLEAAKVVIDAERRKDIILADARNLAFAAGLDLVEDEALLEEVSGLVEWPVVLMGEFEEDFLAIPPEVIRLTIRANQKCFVAASKDALSNRFLLTANIEARDGGAEIARGNGKVVRARLSDALYFWKTDQADLPDLDSLRESEAKFDLDLAKPLDQRMARLDRLGVTFHAKLGTQGERVERIARLAEELAPAVGADPALARRAAVLAKADLQTEVVGEFPELQGAMGRKYALLQGEDTSVAAAIEDHYRPQGPSDRVPTDPVAIAVALADKLDTLVGFWAIDEKPTGSKDPYALRRAALGVIRILVENGVRLKLSSQFAFQTQTLLSGFGRRFGLIDNFDKTFGMNDPDDADIARFAVDPYLAWFLDKAAKRRDINWRDSTDWNRSKNLISDAFYMALANNPIAYSEWMPKGESEIDFSDREEIHRLIDVSRSNFASDLNETADLLSFFHDRLKVYLRDQGARHDLIDAVLGAAGQAPISPREGEMSAQPTEGGAASQGSRETPPSALPGISPSGGEIGQSPAGSSNDDLLVIVRKVEALGALLDTEDGRNLLAGTKRAANILAAEEKKGTAIAAAVNPALFRDEAERRLFAAVNQAESEAAQAIQDEDFSAAMRALAVLREPVDSFFEDVLVNDEDLAVRANRLALLARIRAATGAVADFSRIAG